MLIDRILNGISPNAPIPNPHGPPTYRFKGKGYSANHLVVVYLIPNKNKPHKPSTKRIADFEWEMVDDQLKRCKVFTRDWFKEAMPRRAKTDPCNFRDIGGMLQIIGVVVPDGRDVYRLAH